MNGEKGTKNINTMETKKPIHEEKKSTRKLESFISNYWDQSIHIYYEALYFLTVEYNHSVSPLKYVGIFF